MRSLYFTDDLESILLLDYKKYVYILSYISCLVLQIFLSFEAFKTDTTFDWFNHMAQLIRSCVIFKLLVHGGKRKNALSNGL